MKRLKSVVSLFLVIVLSLSLSINVAAQPQISAAETVTRICEVETLRETNSETYLLSDGTYECVVYAEDKYYLDNSQSLRLIDNSITRVDATTYTTSGQYKNTANAFDVYFSDSGTPEVNILYNENGISFTPVATASKKGVRTNQERSVMTVGKVENCTTLNELTTTGSNTVVYNNAFRDTDLVYVLENSALKEYIILNSANASNKFSFMFTLDNVTMQTADGNAFFAAADGTTIFALDSLFAIDANGVVTENLGYSFAPIADTNKVVITVTLDEEYLSSSARVFPVVIDPTIMISSTETADACVCSGYPNTNYRTATQLRTGYDTDYGIRRSFLKFNIPDTVPGGSVTSATLDIEKLSGAAPTMRAYLCMSSWSSSTITWYNQPTSAVNYIYSSSVSVPFRPGSTWYTMDVTGIVQRWVNGIYTNYGFIIRDENESDGDHWTTLYSSDAPSPHKPELHINYSPYLYSHYYDGSFTASRQNQITNAVALTNIAYDSQFGVEFGSKGAPSFTTNLTSGSHKDIISISNTLNSYSRDTNEIKVFWTDYPDGTYCSHETGVCKPFDALACVYKNRPVIHITNLLSSDGSDAYYATCMSLLLAHETAHTFGLPDNYYRDSHNDYGMHCVMEPYPVDDYKAYNFYHAILMGNADAFCDDCANELSELLLP